VSALRKGTFIFHRNPPKSDVKHNACFSHFTDKHHEEKKHHAYIFAAAHSEAKRSQKTNNPIVILLNASSFRDGAERGGNKGSVAHRDPAALWEYEDGCGGWRTTAAGACLETQTLVVRLRATRLATRASKPRSCQLSLSPRLTGRDQWPCMQLLLRIVHTCQLTNCI